MKVKCTGFLTIPLLSSGRYLMWTFRLLYDILTMLAQGSRRSSLAHDRYGCRGNHWQPGTVNPVTIQYMFDLGTRHGVYVMCMAH